MDGQRLGKYQIEAEIGVGAFARVYRASDTVLGRQVALKVLHPVLLVDQSFVRRFYQEARTIASLRHPNIVTIYDVVREDGRLFIVMDLAEMNLAALVAQRDGLPWREILAMLGPIAAALDYGHRRGVVHRDLKPVNILVGPDDTPLVSDFGFARLIGENPQSVTLSSSIIGTPGYIAPEVWEGDAATPAVDIYALGCIICEMITGKVLFSGPTPIQVMRSHDRGPQFPAEWPKGVPAGVDMVLSRALARAPAERFASTGELVQALRALEPAGQTSAAAPAPALAAQPPAAGHQPHTADAPAASPQPPAPAEQPPAAEPAPIPAWSAAQLVSSGRAAQRRQPPAPVEQPAPATTRPAQPAPAQPVPAQARPTAQPAPLPQHRAPSAARAWIAMILLLLGWWAIAAYLFSSHEISDSAMMPWLLNVGRALVFAGAIWVAVPRLGPLRAGLIFLLMFAAELPYQLQLYTSGDLLMPALVYGVMGLLLGLSLGKAPPGLGWGAVLIVGAAWALAVTILGLIPSAQEIYEFFKGMFEYPLPSQLTPATLLTIIALVGAGPTIWLIRRAQLRGARAEPTAPVGP